MFDKTLVKDQFGKHYVFQTHINPQIKGSLKPKEFHDMHMTRTFLRCLDVPHGFWQSVIMEGNYGITPIGNGQDVELAVSEHIVSGRLKVFEVRPTSTSTGSPEKRRIKQQDRVYHFLPSFEQLLNKTEAMHFSNTDAARALLQRIGASEKQLRDICGELNIPIAANSSAADISQALAKSMVAGDTVVMVDVIASATPPTPLEAVVASTAGNKQADLGPQSEGSAPDDDSPKSDVSSTESNGVQPENKCTTEGEPVSMTSGEELLSLDDFSLPGPIPFIWKRTYRTSVSATDTGIGYGWLHPGPAKLVLHADKVELLTDDGRSVNFTRPARGGKSHQLHEGMTLHYESDGRFLLTQPGQPVKVFDRFDAGQFRLTQWRHKAYVSSCGYALDFQYDNSGRLQRAVGNWGRGIAIERGMQGRITAIYQTDANGEKLQPALARYDYDTAGNLIAHRNAAGHGEKYQYTNHVIMQRTLPSGYVFNFEWDRLDEQAKCLRQAGEDGNYAYAFKWDPENQRSEATNSRGHTTHYRYNSFGLITERIDPEGHAHTKQYNDAGQVAVQIDPLGNRTVYLYDEKQRVLSVTNPLGKRIRHSYLNDELSSVVDAAGQRWTREFNTQGLVAKVIDPRGATTRFEYDLHGQISRVVDPAGRVKLYIWNDRAELLREVDHLGNTLHYHYDAWGRISRVIVQATGQALEHASKGATDYHYTPTGLISKVSNAQGTLVSMEYNESGQLTKHTDEHGRTTQYLYADRLSQPTERIDAAGNRIRYEYDTERNLTALINENGDKYQFFYDGNERLVKEIGFDGRVQKYKYNAAGHLIEHIDSDAVLNKFERNALGLLTTKLSRRIGGDANEAIDRTRYQYDPTGRLVETYNQHQYLSFKYDPTGNILQESQIDLNDRLERLLQTEKVITHRYNPLGQRTHTQLPDGQTLQYDYDDSLSFHSIGINDRIIAAVQRDKLGREVSRLQGELTTSTEYDPQGRLSKQHATNTERKYSPIQREYGYDLYGNLNLIKDGGDETRYVYDTLNRLKQATGASSEFFAFDPAGNLLSMDNQPATAPGKVKGNRLLLQGDRKFSYDGRGNLINESRGKGGSLQTRYTYNLANQLIRVDTQNQRESVEYKYDPLGRRIEKRDAFGVTRFIWTDNLLAQEVRNNLKKTYVYEPGSFRPLAQVQDGQIYHYHLDHLGTPRELTDDSGKVVWKAKYKTYGNLALKEIDEVENNLRFQGQYFDEESGLHYNRFRYYSPDTGQFINQDPIGLLGGMNNYQYVPNPTGWVDPLGLSCKETIPDNYDVMGDFYKGEHGFRIPDGNPEDSITIYRGVHSKHPDFINAVQGKSVPWGGHRDVVAHNEGNNRSDFTSWSTSYEQARVFATTNGNTGVVLEQQVKIKELIWSPDVYLENEILRLGPVAGAKVIVL